MMDPIKVVTFIYDSFALYLAMKFYFQDQKQDSVSLSLKALTEYADLRCIPLNDLSEFFKEKLGFDIKKEGETYLLTYGIDEIKRYNQFLALKRMAVHDEYFEG